MIENCPVTGIQVRADDLGVKRVKAVETPHGTIETPCVVNCAGECYLNDRTSTAREEETVTAFAPFVFCVCVLCRCVGHQAGGDGWSQGASHSHASRLRGDGEN